MTPQQHSPRSPLQHLLDPSLMALCCNLLTKFEVNWPHRFVTMLQKLNFNNKIKNSDFSPFHSLQCKLLPHLTSLQNLIVIRHLDFEI